MLDPILIIFKSSIITIDENIQSQSVLTFYGDKRPEDYFGRSKRVALYLSVAANNTVFISFIGLCNVTECLT